jgi:hypothetical protein
MLLRVNKLRFAIRWSHVDFQGYFALVKRKGKQFKATLKRDNREERKISVRALANLAQQASRVEGAFI